MQLALMQDTHGSLLGPVLIPGMNWGMGNQNPFQVSVTIVQVQSVKYCLLPHCHAEGEWGTKIHSRYITSIELLMSDQLLIGWARPYLG